MVAENYNYRLTRAKEKNMKHVKNELALCGVFCGACPSCHGTVHFYHYKCSKCGKEVIA